MSSEGTEACQPKSGSIDAVLGKNAVPISLSHIPSRCLRLAAARQILSIGITLALLILSVPNASAQQFASRAPAKDISTSGLGQHNKNPRGVWMGVVDGQKVMLVLDARHKKIFTYSMETTPPTRLDNHHNDRAKATKKGT